MSEPTSPQTRFMASSGVVPPRKRTDPKEKRIFPCGTIHGTMPARLNLIRHRHPGAVRGHQELSFSNENGVFRSRRRRLCLICGMGGIRTHVPHLWDNSISSRARCDRFDTFQLHKRPDQPALPSLRQRDQRVAAPLASLDERFLRFAGEVQFLTATGGQSCLLCRTRRISTPRRPSQ